MAQDNSRKPSKRKPTRREAQRAETIADPHYSKLTRKSGEQPVSRASRRSANSSNGTSSRRRAQGSSSRQSSRRTQAPAAQGSLAETSYESLSSGAQKRVYGKRGPRRRKSGNAGAAVIGLAVVAIFILAGVFFWTHRSVALTVNGEQAKIRIGSTLEDVRDKLDITTKPGDYVSVGGNVIEKDKGYAFSASVDGSKLSRKKLNAYRVRGGEQIEIGDGDNRMEKYDIEYREVQPKLLFEGSWGSVSFVKQWGKVGKLEIRTGKDSNETAEGKWVDELQDCIVVTKNIQPADGQKLVALTFDDGPASTYTEEYLRILDEHNAKATFFNLAENEEYLPDLAKKVAESGNQICSHTNHHIQLSTLGQQELISEITSAHDIIANASGVETTIIRPPYGDFNQNCWLLSNGTISASILWNQDTVDWSQPGADAIVSSALDLIQPGAVILMHDGGGPRDQDIEALPQIIERLQASGYTLVTVSELLASDPEVPAEVAKGNATMPADAVWPTEIGEATINVG